MTEEEQLRQNKHRRLWLALVALLAILAVFFVPPFLSINRYKSRITSLMAASLGRPVRLSALRLRLLPRPGFVLYDLTVEEDPAFGAEPLLHAGEVVASIRLLSLWRGRLEISEVSVDEASLNLVHSPDGGWNLDPLLQTAASKAEKAIGQGGHPAPPFPYLEATTSRINFKNGVEKLPFSLVDADVSFWQARPGEWRLRLRGQPARTDLSMELGDTGVVELEANAQSAPDLRKVPIHLDLEWRDAQLGQLTRLVIGSDAGWRGDLRGELHLDGTLDAAQITTRLRAAGVHRAEFAPASPMDFDANCGFVYHYIQRELQNLVCDSPLGNGHIRLAGDLPGSDGLPHFSVELDRLPVAAALDALRTVRSNVAPGMEAAGSISGKITYAETPAASESRAPSSRGPGAPADRSSSVGSSGVRAGSQKPPAKPVPAQGPLTGSFSMEGFQLSGDGLSRPIQAPKMVLAPAPGSRGQAQELAGTVAIPAGGAVPLTLNVRLGLNGYQVTARGQAGITRARELASAAGLNQASALNALAGDPLTVDLVAQGPWLPPEVNSLSIIPPAATPSGSGSGPRHELPNPDAALTAIPATDSLTGSVTLRNVNWMADYLASHVDISEATLHLNNGETSWDPIVFSYGPLQGSASLTLPANCDTPQPCPTRFQLQFGDLDAATFQAAVLGAPEKGTLLSSLVDRLHPSAAPVWPPLEGTVNADSLVLGPVTLRDATADLRILPAGAEIESLDASLLGGSVHGAGALETGDKPVYTLTADFEKLNAVAVGQLLGENWRGGPIHAHAKIQISGYTDKDLIASASGTLHLEWRHGSVGPVATRTKAIPQAPDRPANLASFDRWTADAEIAGGKITLGQNEVLQAGRKHAVEAVVTLAEPPKVTFTVPKQPPAKKH